MFFDGTFKKNINTYFSFVDVRDVA